MTGRTKGLLAIGAVLAGAGAIGYCWSRRRPGRALGDVPARYRDKATAVVRAAGDYNAERRRRLGDIKRWRDDAVAGVAKKARTLNKARNQFVDVCERDEGEDCSELADLALELAVDPSLPDAPSNRELDEVVGEWLGPDKTDAAADLVEATR